MFGVHNRVMEKEKRLYPAAKIHVEALNPFQAAYDGVQDGGLGTSVAGILVALGTLA